MKILVPLNNEKYMQEYIQAGADELYIGFYDKEWTDIFGKYSDINRMSGFGEYANKYNFNEMIEISKKIKMHDCKVFVTMNANSYSKAQLEYIEKKYLPEIRLAKIDGIIVSSLEFGKIVERNGIKAVASTMCAIYNSDIAKIYKENGINRIIVPRDLSLEEIEAISRNVPGVEMEVFFMRNGCVFSDCYCLGMHRPECGATCAMLRKHEKNIITMKTDFEDMHNIMINDEIYNNLFHNEACAMCALYRMKQMGVHSLKIVGRADNPNEVCRDIRITKENIKIANECSSEKEYLEKMIIPFNSIKKCGFGLSCYYPEVRF